MILQQTVKVKWSTRTKSYYESKGYDFSEKGKEVEVKIEDLSHGSHAIIKYSCDYCLRILEATYTSYMRRCKNTIDKDCCIDCAGLKRQEVFLNKYGVEHVLQNKRIRDKMENTMVDRYGVKHAIQNKDIRQKMEDTMIDRYGVKHNMELEETKDKIKETNIQKYGVSCYMQNNQIRQKVQENNLKKYGVTCALQSEEVKEKVASNNLEKYGTKYVSQNKEEMKKIREKANKTMYENGRTISSKQQRYLHQLLGGKLNYPVENCFLDIAFLEEKIYIEYDGSGHDLRVKRGYMNREEFSRKEFQRKAFLQSLGWKLIRIISKKDLLPQDHDIVDLIDKAKEYLSNDHTWYEINIDDSLILNSTNKKEIVIENLRKIME